MEASSAVLPAAPSAAGTSEQQEEQEESGSAEASAAPMESLEGIIEVGATALVLAWMHLVCGKRRAAEQLPDDGGLRVGLVRSPGPAVMAACQQPPLNQPA